jgi:hypothetical protein
MGVYKLGIYFSRTYHSIDLGVGYFNDGVENYIYVSLLFWELAIGRTSR